MRRPTVLTNTTTHRVPLRATAAAVSSVLAAAVLAVTVLGDDRADAAEPVPREPVTQRCYGTADEGVVLTIGADRQVITGSLMPWDHDADRGVLSGAALDEEGIEFAVSVQHLPVAPASTPYSVSTAVWTIDDETISRPGADGPVVSDVIDCNVLGADPEEANESGIALPDLPIGELLTSELRLATGENRTCYHDDTTTVVLDFSDDRAYANGWNLTDRTTISAVRIDDRVEPEPAPEVDVYRLAALVVRDLKQGTTTVQSITAEVTDEAFTPVGGEPVPIIDCLYVGQEPDSIEDFLTYGTYPVYPGEG
ncbi:MAG: hypothetical protein AAF962_26240 [Actinomycetota bacterium]